MSVKKFLIYAGEVSAAIHLAASCVCVLTAINWMRLNELVSVRVIDSISLWYN